MRNSFLRGVVRLFVISLSLAMISGCDNDFSGGDGGSVVICIDYDGDGYGVLYPGSQAFSGFPKPVVACGTAVDIDDTDPTLWGSANPPMITSTAPASVNEGTVYSYNLICEDPDVSSNLVLAVGPFDNCGGTVADNGDGTGTYSFATTEAMGGSTCLAVITCTDNQADLQEVFSQAATVIITETPGAPILTNLPATQAGPWNRQANSFDVDATDPDVPPDNLSFFGPTNSTCSFVTAISITSGLVSWFCTNVERCTVQITVVDDSPSALSDTQTLTIECTL